MTVRGDIFVHVHIGNAAVQEPGDVAAIIEERLRTIYGAQDFRELDGLPLFDYNGNTVGKITVANFEEDDED